MMGAESYRIVAEEANLERMVQIFIDALVSVRAQSEPGDS
jgi:hypothetical protein